MPELTQEQHIIFHIMERLGMSLAVSSNIASKDKPAGKMYLLAGEFYGELTDNGRGLVHQSNITGEKIQGTVEDFVKRAVQETGCAGILPLTRQTKDLLEKLGLTLREYQEGSEILVYK